MPETPPSPGELAPATVHDLAALVAYGDGAIVSRVIARGPAESLTLFAFDAGQGLSEHTTPFNAWVYVIEGRLQLRIGQDEVEAGAGQVVAMPGGVPHALTAPVRARMLLVLLRTRSSTA